MIEPDGTCSRCSRPYRTEVADNGQCCICNRDDRMIAKHGPDWRSVIQSERQ